MVNITLFADIICILFLNLMHVWQTSQFSFSCVMSSHHDSARFAFFTDSHIQHLVTFRRSKNDIIREMPWKGM